MPTALCHRVRQCLCDTKVVFRSPHEHHVQHSSRCPNCRVPHFNPVKALVMLLRRQGLTPEEDNARPSKAAARITGEGRSKQTMHRVDTISSEIVAAMM